MSDFEKRWADCGEKVESFLKQRLENRKEQFPEGTEKYYEALEYSLFSGGKRFRPALVFMTAEALGLSDEEVIAYAAAVEMIHCFSLVHDDLPCMDDDDFRRGKPTVHKQFDEATALLAGDGLITEAFELIAEAYEDKPSVAIKLVKLLAACTGSAGMIGGQILDLHAQKEMLEVAELEQVHLHKTGALIRSCCEGAAIIAGVDPQKEELLVEYANHLGLSFQVKDDLLEVEDNKVELGSYPQLMGVVASNVLLKEMEQTCIKQIDQLNAKPNYLKEIVAFNLNRTK
jgi:geranylgeranyl diphosphate synthase type II